MDAPEEESFALAFSSASDAEFDAVVGYLEDIIMDAEFQLLQRNFMDKYYQEFEDTEENKLTYTPIFNEYIPSTQEKRSYLLHSWLPVTGRGGAPCCPLPPPTSPRSSCRRAVPCAAAVPRGPGRMLTEDGRCIVVLWYPQRSAWSLAHRIGS
ncbi:ADP-ribosylation factor-like protein 2-binding protein isoform X3 [Neomonachus schauinslandi]|uniref:ADP-ribosylation factor-like protein 2-binding protein n=1 Tax=Neomonachus schauinslandi TaxID=29088 RepID=A0A2Y9ICQ7_NEOSC|nr:ADP-ribosylation factor-like protein 2-binding protein isoform X3 [Neomonachus schauinslandi]